MIEAELLKQVCGIHPAYTMPFDELLAGLNREIENDNINCQTDGGSLRIYCYSRNCTYSNAWNIFTMMARGLILDVDKKLVVATPFPKFFNYGETLYAPDEPFETTDKVDGSLGIIFYHDKKWKIATKLSFTSEQSRWAEKWFVENVSTRFLEIGFTYLAEIVYRDNMIVVPYDFEGLVLITVYGMYESSRTSDVYQNAVKGGFLPVKSVKSTSIEELLQRAEYLTCMEEGFVVQYQSGHRLKIKGKEYLRIHRLISNCTPLAIWDCVRKCDDLDGIRKELPEEFWHDFDFIRSAMEEKYNSIIVELKEAVKQFAGFSDKELGLTIQLSECRVTDVVMSLIFACRKKGLIEESQKASVSRDKIFKLFRPDGNVLEGYVPNRKIEEDA